MQKIYIAGHRGMVGSAILRRLEARREQGEALELLTRTHAELDLTDQAAVRNFMQAEESGGPGLSLCLRQAKPGGEGYGS